MNDYSKTLVKVIFTELENVFALFLQFCSISTGFVSFRFVLQNSISHFEIHGDVETPPKYRNLWTNSEDNGDLWAGLNDPRTNTRTDSRD